MPLPTKLESEATCRKCLETWPLVLDKLFDCFRINSVSIYHYKDSNQGIVLLESSIRF